MDVFNKFYSQVSNSVSSTVAQLSSVLPGNPVTREYEASTLLSSAGPNLAWKIYKGHKRNTKQGVSIFVFDKRQLDKCPKRSDRDLILDSLKRGISQLTKLRHPLLLTVEHPLEESRESLAFATEPVLASLANIFGNTTNMPQPYNNILNCDHQLHDIDIKYGLMQLSQALAFLHNDVRLLHNNLCPESVVVNEQGAWKLFGFDFSVKSTTPLNEANFYPWQDFYCPTLPACCRANLNYTAPDSLLQQSLSTDSDMFALGMLIYSIYTRGQVLHPIEDCFQCDDRLEKFKSLTSPQLGHSIPAELVESVRMLLSCTPHLRPNAFQFTKMAYFEDDVRVKTLHQLESLLQWDNIQRSQFYKSLPDALEQLPLRVQLHRVIPCLQRDLAQPTMIPFILPSIFRIANNTINDKENFRRWILPHLKPIMRLTEPPQILLLMLQRMQLLLKLTPADDIQLHVLPMLYRGLDSNSAQLHELCLGSIPTFANLIDHANMKNSLVPRIKKLCLGTSNLSVRVNCLACVAHLLDALDKWLVLDEILPFLPQIPSREPAVLMAIFGIYKLTLQHERLGIGKELLATRILPFLMPLAIDNGLSMTQFDTLVVLIKQMFNIVETEHRNKLKQLSTVRDEQKLLVSSMPSMLQQQVITNGNSSNTISQNVNDIFSSLTLNQEGSIGTTTTTISLDQKQYLMQQQNSLKAFHLDTKEQLKPTPVSFGSSQTTTMMNKKTSEWSCFDDLLQPAIANVQNKSTTRQIPMNQMLNQKTNTSTDLLDFLN